jgi:hypothetical protein
MSRQNVKQARKAAEFQQQQANHARQFNAQSAGVLNGTSTSGTKYTLNYAPVAFGSRDLCVGALAINCMQVHFELLKQNITQQLLFDLARTIESQKETVVNNGQSQTKDKADSFVYAFTQTCMDEKKLAQLVSKLVDQVFTPNGTRDTTLDAGCVYISQYIKNLRFTMQTSPISDQTCRLLERQMQDTFVQCIDTAITNAGLVYLSLLAILPLAIGTKVALDKICGDNGMWGNIKRKT